jgi:hypothetical protein
LPTLKNGNFFGFIFTFSPVLGFRPVYAPYFLSKKEQSPGFQPDSLVPVNRLLQAKGKSIKIEI